MKKGEKVVLTVKPQCKFLQILMLSTVYFHMYCLLTFSLFWTDGFGEKGKQASGSEGAVPPNATLLISLELVSWKAVSEVTDDKKVIKKILKEGEGYEKPNEGAVVKGYHLIEEF